MLIVSSILSLFQCRLEGKITAKSYTDFVSTQIRIKYNWGQLRQECRLSPNSKKVKEFYALIVKFENRM
jgi:hypothetical protein